MTRYVGVNGMRCEVCRAELPGLLQAAEAMPAEVPSGVAAHLAGCAVCRAEWEDMQATWALMDLWSAPEPSAFFDTKVHARLREAQSAAPAGWWERWTSFVQLSTGRQLRPVAAGALGLVMLLGGGAAATLVAHHGVSAVPSSPTVNDLRIFDNNAQAVEQMDLLDEPSAAADGAPQS